MFSDALYLMVNTGISREDESQFLYLNVNAEKQYGYVTYPISDNTPPRRT